jgi:hypothetical protein
MARSTRIGTSRASTSSVTAAIDAIHQSGGLRNGSALPAVR